MAESKLKAMSNKLLVRAIQVADGLSINANGWNGGYYDVAYSGYTPLGILGVHIQNATTDGANSSVCFLFEWRLINNEAVVYLRNTAASAAKVKLVVDVLYEQD